MLRHDEARRWIPQAEQLFAATEDEQEPLVIWETALSQGLPVTELVEWVGRQANNLAEPACLAAEDLSAGGQALGRGGAG